MSTKITVQAIVEMPIAKVWELWTEPSHIMGWNNATDDWHTPSATNDLKVGGEFHYQMAAKDGSFEFDYWGTYSEIEPMHKIGATLGDGRSLEILFKAEEGTTEITEIFEAETQNPVELQQMGWQAILNNFKRYAEGIDNGK
jgi:uncharacterized protein YndB with AHSA1/START domain